MRVLTLVLLASCAAPRHAETFAKRGADVSGPRWVTVVGNDDDVRAMERALALKGFRVSTAIPEVKSALPTKYVLHISGICTGRGSAFVSSIGVDVTPLRVDLFDASASERVFAARLDNESDCPEAFFAEVASALARNWATSDR